VEDRGDPLVVEVTPAMTHATDSGSSHTRAGKSHYRRLLLMTAVSFVAMYVLMYAMVNAFANVHHNLNQFYMAGLMTAAMVVIELIVLREMYHNRRLNTLIGAAGVLALIVFWLFIRQQIAIGDRQFLKSMIPHHAGAILMCQQTTLLDAEIQRLCRNIISGQQAEIYQMKAKLSEL
jgi:cation transport ATPase